VIRGRRGVVRARIAVVALGAALATWLLAAPAQALPPGGAGPSTPGTSSTVSGSVKAGGSIRFTLTGFPGGEVVYVKIDDGQGYSDQTLQGAGVVYQQKIPSSGTVSGSFALPSVIGTGKHWLRFLASEEFVDAKGNQGINGFTNRSPSFTVVATSNSTGTKDSSKDSSKGSSQGTDTGSAGTSSTKDGDSGASGDDGTTSSVDAPATDGGAATADPVEPGAVVTAPAAPEATPLPTALSSAVPTPSATDVAAPQSAPAATPAVTPAPVAAAPSDGGGGFPVVGLAAVVAVLVLGGLGAWLALRPRRTTTG